MIQFGHDATDYHAWRTPIFARMRLLTMTDVQIGASAARGVLVTLLSRWGSTVTMLASSVVLARILSPHDFGLVALVTALTGFAVLFQDLGLTSAAVRTKHLNSSEQTTLFLLNVVLGAVLTCAVFVAAPFIADFYSQPQVTDIARALSVSFLITSLAGQARANLLRDLRFGVIAGAEIAINLVQFIVALVLALAGFGYWALILGSLVSSVCWAVTLVTKSNFSLAKPAPLSSVRHLVVQGAQITVVQASTYLSRNLDVIAVGRFYGAETVGLYNRASQVVGIVEQQLTAAMTAVALPVLSKLQDDQARFQSAVDRAVRAIGYTLTPLFTTLSLAAVPAVTLVYGSQWKSAGHLLVILALAGTVRSFFLLVELAATALGQMGRQISGSLTTQIISACALLVAAYFSITAVAVTYVVCTFLSVVTAAWWIARGTTIDIRRTVMVFAVPACLWTISYTIATLARLLIAPNSDWLGALLAVAIQLACAVLAFAVVPLVRRDVKQVLGMVKLAVKGKIAAKP